MEWRGEGRDGLGWVGCRVIDEGLGTPAGLLYENITLLSPLREVCYSANFWLNQQKNFCMVCHVQNTVVCCLCTLSHEPSEGRPIPRIWACFEGV